MSRPLSFLQIVIAALIGCTGADIIKGFSTQCVSRDSKGCAETRLQCLLNNRTTYGVIPNCITEKEL